MGSSSPPAARGEKASHWPRVLLPLLLEPETNKPSQWWGGRFPVATSILSRAMPYWGPLLALFCTATAVLVHQALCTCCPSAVGPTLPADRPVFGVLETPRSCTSVRDHLMPFQLSISGSSGPPLPPHLSKRTLNTLYSFTHSTKKPGASPVLGSERYISDRQLIACLCILLYTQIFGESRTPTAFTG